jgi:molecular chaperone DnaJ
MKNFYETLGVNETATQEEIKKSYRKLAVEHHPDKGGDENKFKEISEAFDTIGDNDKRQQYDNQRSNPFGGGGFNPFGGGGNPFEDMFNNMHSQRQPSVPDKVIEVVVGALESYNGSDKTITYQRKHKCGDCNGNGGDRVTCNVCRGEGFTIQRIGTGMFIQMVRQVCYSCNGKGFSYSRVCGSCNGETTKSSTENLSIKLPHGVDDGQFLRLQGKGDFHNGIYGNLVLRIKVSPENNFEKLGNDLIYNAFFDLESLKKDTLDVNHPKGNISVKLPIDFDTTKPLRVKSKGFNNVGDLFIKLNVKFSRR